MPPQSRLFENRSGLIQGRGGQNAQLDQSTASVQIDLSGLRRPTFRGSTRGCMRSAWTRRTRRRLVRKSERKRRTRRQTAKSVEEPGEDSRSTPSARPAASTLPRRVHAPRWACVCLRFSRLSTAHRWTRPDGRGSSPSRAENRGSPARRSHCGAGLEHGRTDGRRTTPSRPGSCSADRSGLPGTETTTRIGGLHRRFSGNRLLRPARWIAPRTSRVWSGLAKIRRTGPRRRS